MSMFIPSIKTYRSLLNELSFKFWNKRLLLVVFVNGLIWQPFNKPVPWNQCQRPCNKRNVFYWIFTLLINVERYKEYLILGAFVFFIHTFNHLLLVTINIVWLFVVHVKFYYTFAAPRIESILKYHRFI